MARKQIPAGARKRPGGGWEWRFTYKGIRCSVGAGNLDKLQEKHDEKKREIDAGLYTANRNITVGQYFDEWIDRKKSVLKESSLFSYKTHFETHIRPEIGNIKLKALERRQLLALQKKVSIQKKSSKGRRQGRPITGGPVVANRVIFLMKSLLKSAMDDEIIIRNVAATIPPIKVEKRPARETCHRELSDEELRIFFKYADRSIYGNAFRFMLYTGVRAGECGGLEWQDVDWKGKVIHVRRTMTVTENGKFVVGSSTKTRKSTRDIFMNEDIFSLVMKQYEIYSGLHGKVMNLYDPIFPTSRGHHPSGTSFYSVIKFLLKQAHKNGEKIDNFGTHAFRDTFASKAIRAGMPPNVLKEILGHTSYKMTMDLYVHTNEDDKRQAMQSLKMVNI